MRLHATWVLLGLALCGPVAAANLYVIVNANGSVQSLSRHDVAALFTGRLRTLPDGTMVAPLDHPADSQARAAFYRRLTGMDLARINSYWSRLLFTGQGRPPRPVADDAAMVAAVRGNRAAVGYVTTPPDDPGVRAAFVLSDEAPSP
jgi:hypothetical protein